MLSVSEIDVKVSIVKILLTKNIMLAFAEQWGLQNGMERHAWNDKAEELTVEKSSLLLVLKWHKIGTQAIDNPKYFTPKVDIYNNITYLFSEG